ncbi:MAG: response regulator transcription factor [Bacteroidota bacterium]
MKTLLIVDDEPAIRLLLKQFFMKRYNVILLDGGKQAVEWLDANTAVPVIVLDLNMPEIGGFEVIKKVRASAHHSAAPLIVLSSKESSADRIACLRAGADDYVVKPFNPEELDARIDAILRRV